MPLTSFDRNRSPMAPTKGPPTVVPLEERDIRLEDYLNDKIQSASDFGHLANLVASVEEQNRLLEEQLTDAIATLEDSKNASANTTSTILERTREFEQHYDAVQRRLMIVTSSDTPEEAAMRMKVPMEKLRRVELARSYVELLKDVDDLTNAARSHLPADPKQALKPYTHLKELSLSLNQLQEQAEGAAVHLVTHVDRTTSQLWVQMKKIMTDEFEAVLHKSKWPDSSVEPSRKWVDCFSRLLDLQGPEIMNTREPLVLLPIGVLANHFILEFRFHFFSNKSTNKPHALGQYFFPWVIGTVQKQQTYLQENVAPVLAAHFRSNDLAGNSLYVDPVAGFITALLPVVKEKVDSIASQVVHEPEYLSKFIGELMDFDETIRSKFSYDGGNPEFGWKGLTWEVLDKWFDKWSEIEKNFALHRYQEIIKSPDAGDIDYDGAPQGKTKTTYGAEKVTDLITTVTISYKKLRKFSHKVRFLINIQAEILDQYLGRLKDSLEAYQAATSAVGRTLHGVTKEQQQALEGIGGLESLCKVYGSAEHLISMLKEWSNDEFFIQLWDELQEKAKTTGADGNLAGSMTYTEVKDVTSSSVGLEEEGSLFDVTIDGYKRVRDKSETLIEQAIRYSFATIFKQYLNKPQWTTIGDIPTYNAESAITAELDLPVQTLKEYLAFLIKALSTSSSKRIWRNCSGALQDMLFNDILLRQDFTSLGASRLMHDTFTIRNVIQSYIPSDVGTSKLTEGIALLNLPVEADEGQLTLKEANKKAQTNAEVEALLKDLQMTHLSFYEARLILQRRVESHE